MLSPHPDDAEFSCGATIHRLVSAGAKVHVVTFSPCVKSLPKGLPFDILYQEQFKAMGALGVDMENVINLDYPVRDFPAHRQNILEDLIKFRSSIQPDLVIAPNSNDIHQDHQVIFEEARRAFKSICTIGYELPWNNLINEINMRSAISQENLDAKMLAISAYASQKSRPYMNKDFFLGLALVRGVMINSKFAEGFQIINWKM